MAASSRTLLPVLLLVLALALGAGAWLLLGGGDPEGGAVPLAVPGGAGPATASSDRPAPQLATREPELPDVPRFGDVETTVAWPVKIDLELVRAARYPTHEDARPIGSGRSANLTGRISDNQGVGSPVEVHFLHGLNAGRVLRSDLDGSFGASDLYPGLSLVEVRGASVPGAVREVRLRDGATEELNIGFGLPAPLAGTVFGEDAEPLQGVRVEIDGSRSVTDVDGIFYFERATPGRDVPIFLSKDGWAAHREQIGVAVGQRADAKRLQFVMQRSATLDISLRNKIGSSGDTTAILLPANERGTRDFPWHTVNPVTIGPSKRVRIEGLPPKKIHVHLFHGGAVFDPEVTVVNLHPGEQKRVSAMMVPAPQLQGVVKNAAGKPQANARVLLEAPNRTKAALQYFGQLPWFLETEIMPMPPVAVQETRTDAQGYFQLSAWHRYAPRRYLQAWNVNGKLWGSRIVGPDDDSVEVTVEPYALGESVLEVDFPGRSQGLPIEVTLNGGRLVATTLPPGEPLVLRELTEGTWKLGVAWNGLPVLSDSVFELDGELSREVGLPQGAIVGQDPETVSRARKH